MNLRSYLNRLLVDEQHGCYWTVVKVPNARKFPYQFHRANEVNYEVGEWPYKRTILRNIRAFEPWLEQVNESRASELVESWKLRVETVNNGYPEAFEALLAEANRRGLPRDYRSDLDIDKRQLCSPGWATPAFLWVLRTMGTHLFNIDPGSIELRDGGRPTELIRAMGQFGDPEVYWYVYRDIRLTEISKDRAFEIAEDAVREAEQLKQD